MNKGTDGENKEFQPTKYSNVNFGQLGNVDDVEAEMQSQYVFINIGISEELADLITVMCST
jgi:hypothetical protein